MKQRWVVHIQAAVSSAVTSRADHQQRTAGVGGVA
jgi:hypothetical protein